MIAWRFSNHATLDGGGGLRAPGRWHSRGRRIVYLSANPATALLEMLVHMELGVAELPLSYQLLKVGIADDINREAIDPGDLPSGWRSRYEVTRKIGDDWLRSGASAILEVPCAIVAETTNILLNPAHPDGRRVAVLEATKAVLDERLFGA